MIFFSPPGISGSRSALLVATKLRFVPVDSPYFDGNAHVAFPASSAYALACGGTHLVSPNLGNPVEEVWHPAYGVGTGGGIGRYFPVPDYQRGIVTQNAVNPPGGPGRGIPDVCATPPTRAAIGF